MCEFLDMVEKKGKDKVRTLIKYLIDNNRMSDLEKVLDDEDYCDKLINELKSNSQ